jgi:hypothetical protein
MASYKQVVKDTRTPEEIAIQAAANSHYNICTPLYEVQNVRITDPVTRLDHIYRVGSEQLANRLAELVELGLGMKLDAEFAQFETEIDHRWGSVKQQVIDLMSDQAPSE